MYMVSLLLYILLHICLMFYTDEIQLKFPWYLCMHALMRSSPIVKDAKT